jgi:hypothetical protein
MIDGLKDELMQMSPAQQQRVLQECGDELEQLAGSGIS